MLPADTRHPELFEEALRLENKVRYEQTAMQGRKYTWSQGETLEELVSRRDEILKADEAARLKASKSSRLLSVLDDEEDETPCLVCHL